MKTKQVVCTVLIVLLVAGLAGGMVALGFKTDDFKNWTFGKDDSELLAEPIDLKEGTFYAEMGGYITTLEQSLAIELGNTYTVTYTYNDVQDTIDLDCCYLDGGAKFLNDGIVEGGSFCLYESGKTVRENNDDDVLLAVAIYDGFYINGKEVVYDEAKSSMWLMPGPDTDFSKVTFTIDSIKLKTEAKELLSTSVEMTAKNIVSETNSLTVDLEPSLGLAENESYLVRYTVYGKENFFIAKGYAENDTIVLKTVVDDSVSFQNETVSLTVANDSIVIVLKDSTLEDTISVDSIILVKEPA